MSPSLTISHIDGQPIALNTPVLPPTGAEVQLNGDGTSATCPPLAAPYSTK